MPRNTINHFVDEAYEFDQRDAEDRAAEMGKDPEKDDQYIQKLKRNAGRRLC